ncbi:Receptor-like protein kinase HSL1 [Hordeum vulgare]|nr:Receptor-like protein kinase HSL1 [Hordeum vulgare]
MQHIIFEGRGEAFHVHDQEQAFDPDETESQDDCDTYDDTQFANHDDGDEDDHGNSWHADDDLYCEDEEEKVDISAEPLLVLIKDCPKFKDQYNTLKKKRGQKATVADDGDVLKRPRGRTNSKADEKRGASSIALQGTLKTMMSQKEMREERKSKGKKEQIKIYLDLQTKKLDMEKVVKRRKLDIKEAAQRKKLEIEATIAETKAKEVALALMCIDKNNMSPERKA